ncbi:MAG: hypothetical protein AAFO79_01655 [Pseudomonadota bacterium]
MDLAIIFALALSVAMLVAATSVVFFHDQKFSDIEQRVDYSFSTELLTRVFLYYRGFGVLMLLFFALFTLSLYALQIDSGLILFEEGRASIIGIAAFAFDLVARGAFFDWMEHFQWSLSPLSMNREYFWFVMYAFVFRMFYALTLLRILISFVWIYRKVKRARAAYEGDWRAGGGG